MRFKNCIALHALLSISMYVQAAATDIYIACKVLPANVQGVKESEAVDGLYTVTEGGMSMRIGTSDRKLPLTTTDQKYSWQLVTEHNGASLTIREEINRVTGQYAMFIDGPKGTMQVSKGTCGKAEKKF